MVFHCCESVSLLPPSANHCVYIRSYLLFVVVLMIWYFDGRLTCQADCWSLHQISPSTTDHARWTLLVKIVPCTLIWYNFVFHSFNRGWSSCGSTSLVDCNMYSDTQSCRGPAAASYKQCEKRLIVWLVCQCCFWTCGCTINFGLCKPSVSHLLFCGCFNWVMVVSESKLNLKWT